jgi:hypothetical protein
VTLGRFQGQLGPFQGRHGQVERGIKHFLERGQHQDHRVNDRLHGEHHRRFKAAATQLFGIFFGDGGKNVNASLDQEPERGVGASTFETCIAVNIRVRGERGMRRCSRQRRGQVCRTMRNAGHDNPTSASRGKRIQKKKKSDKEENKGGKLVVTSILITLALMEI